MSNPLGSVSFSAPFEMMEAFATNSNYTTRLPDCSFVHKSCIAEKSLLGYNLYCSHFFIDILNFRMQGVKRI